MTIDVSDNNPRINYSIAEGVTQTVFSVPFEFFEDSNVYIYVDGVLKTEGLDYTLTGGDGSTGTLTFVTATPPDVQQVTGAAGGTVVSIVRHVELERVTDFVAGQDINRAALNEQLDTIVAQIADLDDKVDRTIHLSDSEVAPSMLLTEDRKGRVLAFDATTGDVEAGPLSNDIQTIADNIAEILAADAQAAASAASATASASSASSSASSAAASASSATDAAASETAAAASEAAAASSETNAASSASTASTSASNAATSETNAASSASSAASSASSASASADAALSALDSFDDRYLGQKVSDPTLDNDGNALVAGALYFNTTDGIMKVYDGSVWLAAYASLSGALIAANNLSDLVNAATARANLGLGTAATTASTDYATAAQGALADSAIQSGDNVSALTNDAGYTTNVGDITGVTAGTGLSGGGTSGSVTLSHADTSTLSGTYGSTADGTKIDQITVDANGHVTAITTGATGDIQGVTAGSGITGGGTSGTVTISHADTSSQGSVNNSGATFIQDVTVDTYGHVTGLGSATLSAATVGALAATNPVISAGTITEDVYAISGTSVSIEPDNGSIQTHTLSGNTTYSNGFSAGQAITLMIDDGSARTVTWPSMTWVNNGGSAPTLATSGYTTVALWRVGSTLYGALVGDGS